MEPVDPDPRGRSIRISREDAMSTHVDDLLKRQLSLRGETGVTRDRGRRWYYQNWLVFMIAGSLAAVTAWVLIEPYLDDMPYFQGTIEQIDLFDLVIVHGNAEELQKRRPDPGDRGRRADVELGSPGVAILGWIKIKGQKIWLNGEVKELLPDGSKSVIDPAALKPGQTVGVYVSDAYQLRPQVELIWVCHFLVPSPPAQSPGDAALTLTQRKARSDAAYFLFFPLVGGLIGLFIGAIDGLVCRLLRRALLAGFVGLLVGFIGGFLSSILAGLVYLPFQHVVQRQMESGASLTTFGFLVQMVGRSLAWTLAGMAMGLGQGIALRSRRLLLYGLIGGLIGGCLGGILFDPIDILLLGLDKPSAHWSRLIGLSCIGGCVGLMIGVVELLARDAWLRMTEGPLAGKEFLLFKDVLLIGSSPRSDIYLFNDSEVEPHHATLRAVGDECELESALNEQPALLNGRPLRRSRLRHGDRITIGRTSFVFQKRQG